MTHGKRLSRVIRAAPAGTGGAFMKEARQPNAAPKSPETAAMRLLRRCSRHTVIVMRTTKAVVVDPAALGRFVISEFPAPEPAKNEAIVRVKAVSVNRGEVRYSMSAPAGRRPGWDLAGIVEKAAADGTGPKEGARVVGLLSLGSWAQLVAVPTNALAELPAGVSFEAASTLPVAGLTSLHSLYKGGFLLGKKVLVTGATGGTGDFTIQLAKLGGAVVVGLTRSRDRESVVREFGADHVVVGDDLSPAAALGAYDLIVDSVGGAHFGKTVEMLAPRGVCVIFGATAGTEISFNASKFYPTGHLSIYGFILFKELDIEPASVGLKILGDLVAAGKLKPRIEIVESWGKVVELTQQLTDRKFVGKAVLQVD
jgi:NADPH:quinone reductase